MDTRPRRITRLTSAGALLGALAVALLPIGSANAAATCFDQAATIADHTGAIVGTNGDDVSLGDNGINTIDGKGGDDLICGRGGADEIDAGDDDDRVDGGGGKDTINGGTGTDDLLLGGPDADDFFGGGGADLCAEATGEIVLPC